MFALDTVSDVRDKKGVTYCNNTPIVQWCVRISLEATGQIAAISFKN